MSLPITATGPLKVETKPILTGFCCAAAGRDAERERRAGQQDCLSHCILPSELCVQSSL